MAGSIITSGNHSLYRIEPDSVDSTLQFLRPILSKSIQHTEGFETVDEMVEVMRESARPWQLWVINDGSKPVGGFISTIERVGSEMVFTFEILAGVDAQSWILPMISNFEQYLSTIYDITQIRIIGREGWSRFLRDSGYAPQCFITAKKSISAGVSNVERITAGPDNPELKNDAPTVRLNRH